jgi:hypothetical protein
MSLKSMERQRQVAIFGQLTVHEDEIHHRENTLRNRKMLGAPTLMTFA